VEKREREWKAKLTCTPLLYPIVSGDGIVEAKSSEALNKEPSKKVVDITLAKEKERERD
jgi:hypothetical protein